MAELERKPEDLQGPLPQIVQTRNQIQGLAHLTALRPVQMPHVRFPENAAGSDQSSEVHLQFVQSLHLAVDPETENEHPLSVQGNDPTRSLYLCREQNVCNEV